MAVNGCDYSIFTSHNFVSRKEGLVFKWLSCSLFAERQTRGSSSWIEWLCGNSPQLDRSISHAVSLLLNCGEELGPYKAAGVPLLRSCLHFL